MTTALLHVQTSKDDHALVADLQAAGIQVLGTVADRSKLLQEVVRHAPDVVVCDAPVVGEALFAVCQTIARTAPCAFLVFTADTDAGRMEQAIASGIHAYVVNGYGAPRLRALIHLAQARFRQEQAQRTSLHDLSVRLEERKMVDRAKGILMRSHHLSDDDAFHMLRTASMHTNQRLGQVSQRIVESARWADDVNRSGQLRMLSQRLGKLFLLQLAGVPPEQCRAQFDESVQRVEANLAHLAKSLSLATYGDLLHQVMQAWNALRQVLHSVPASPNAAAYIQTDAQADQLMQAAERLTSNLELASAAPPLRVLNLAGRQRMLSQRFAKYAVLSVLVDAPLLQRCEAVMAEAKMAFELALTYLNGIPLSTADIRQELEAAGIGWLQMLAIVKDARHMVGPQRLLHLQRLAQASEDLLGVFERLSAHYEQSMQTLAGG